MVLVSQTEFRDRQVMKAFIIDGESAPANHHIEGRQNEAHVGLEIFLDAVGHLLGVANNREHGQNSFHEHATSPGLGLADFHVRRIPRRAAEALVGQHDHAFIELLHKAPEVGVVRVGGATTEGAHAAELVEHETQFPADNPAFVAQSLLADLGGAASLADGMDELDAVGVSHAQDGGIGHEATRPISMRGEEAKQPGAFRQLGEQRSPLVGWVEARRNPPLAGNGRCPGHRWWVSRTQPTLRLRRKTGTATKSGHTLPKEVRPSRGQALAFDGFVKFVALASECGSDSREVTPGSF